MHADTLKVFDSNLERFSLKAISEGIRPGHYKIDSIKLLATAQFSYGVGRIFIADLGRRDISALIADQKAEPTLDDHRVRIDDRIATVGGLGGAEGISIHGGSTVTGSMAMLKLQPLTNPVRGIRIHNAELIKLMDFLAPRLRCQQLIVLTVCT